MSNYEKQVCCNLLAKYFPSPESCGIFQLGGRRFPIKIWFFIIKTGLFYIKYNIIYPIKII